MKMRKLSDGYYVDLDEVVFVQLASTAAAVRFKRGDVERVDGSKAVGNLRLALLAIADGEVEEVAVEKQALVDLVKLCAKYPEIKAAACLEALQSQAHIYCACVGTCTCGIP